MSLSELSEEIAKRLEAKSLSERKACLMAGLKVDAIRNIKRGRAPRATTLQALAKVLGGSANSLIEIAGDLEEEEEIDAEEIPQNYVSVPSLKIRAGMGGGGFDDEDLMGPPELMPEPLIRGELRGDPLDFLAMEVEGQSMEPILLSGDRVLVDRRKVNPSQAGVFVIHEGFGYVAKYVERVIGAEPATLRIKSANPLSESYERTTDEVRVIGRVVWFARRL